MDIGGGGFFQAALVVTLQDIRQVVTVTQKSVIGVSLPGGELLWEYAFPGGVGGTMPMLYDDSLIISALDRGVTCFKPVRRNGTWSVVPVWTANEVSMYIIFSSSSATPLRLVASWTRAALCAGRQLRRTDPVARAPPRAAENAAFAKAGDLLFVLKNNGELLIARASRTAFNPLKRYTV